MAKNPYSMPTRRSGNQPRLMINPKPVDERNFNTTTIGGGITPSTTSGRAFGSTTGPSAGYSGPMTVDPMEAQRQMAEQARQDALRRQQAAARGATNTINPTVGFRPSPIKKPGF